MARPSLREKLASSAVDTLHTLGFKGCSIQDITEAAGVPKGSFFNHFENKEDLAIDALRRYLEGSRAEMLFDESVPPLERLKNHFKFLSERLIERASSAAACLGFSRRRWRANIRRCARSCARCSSDGAAPSKRCCAKRRPRARSIPAMTPRELARFLVNAWEGATIRLKITQDRQPIDDFLNIAFKALLK